MQWNKHVWSLFLHILPYFSINRTENVAYTLKIPFLTLDFSKQNGVSVNFRASFRRHNIIYTRATFSRTKASAKWSVTAAMHCSVPSSMQIRALFRLFQVKAMFKQHVNLMIWTWLLRLQTASRNEFPCKNSCFSPLSNLVNETPCSNQEIGVLFEHGVELKNFKMRAPSCLHDVMWTRLVISPMLMFAKTLHTVMTLWRRYVVLSFFALWLDRTWP